MALILDSRSWQDKDGNLTPVTAGVLKGAFAEERVLTLNYSFDQSLNDCEILFNPALFVEQGITLEQSQTLPPSTAYWYKVTTATPAASEIAMNLLNSNPTERNMSVSFELNADRLSFKIRLTCFLTADILRFLSNENIDNSIRLLGNTKNANELENLEDSIYNFNTTKGIGIHTGVKVPSVSQLCGIKGDKGKDGIVENTYIADSENFTVRFKPYTAVDKCEVFVNGVLTASSGKNAGNNFGAIDGFDGNAGAGYPIGGHPNPPVVPVPNLWYVGGATTFNNRLADFTADTGLVATLGGYQQIIWVNCQIGDTIVVRIAGSTGTVWDYEIYCPQSSTTIPSTYEYSDGWINTELLFLNEGTMSDPVFELSRNSIIETEFATFADTDVKLQIDHTSAITQAKVWVIDADNTVQSLDFKKAYGYQPSNYFDVPVPTNIGGNVYETNFVVDSTKLNAGGRYFIIAVYYDSANEYVASYISDSIFVSDVQFLTPTATGTIYNLVANLASNYVEVSPLQRVCCEITLTKYTGFDAAYLGGNIQIAGETFTFFGNNNQGDFTFSDSSGSLIIRFYLRTKEEWQNTEVDVLWNINFNVEYTTIAFPQRLAISQMEQNKVTPNLTEIKLYKDGITLLEEGDTACDANFLRVETIKEASAVNYAQAAIWKDENGNVYEEEAWSPISVFSQSTNAFQSDVEIQFGSTGLADDVNHKITNDVDNGEVGMIGYPPPLPLNFIRHSLQSQTNTGKNTVIIAEYDYIGSKSIALLNGFTSADYLFKIGLSTTAENGNSSDWGLFPDLTFAAFAASNIDAGKKILIKFVGSPTQTDVCGYLEFAIEETPINPKVISFVIPKNMLAYDFMLYNGLNTNIDSALLAGGTGNFYSSKIAASVLNTYEGITNFTAGLSGFNSPNNGLIPRLFIERTNYTGDVTLNLTVNQIQNANIEIGNPATPMRNDRYSLTEGDNVDCFESDQTNDKCQLVDASDYIFNNVFDYPNWSDGQVVSICSNAFSSGVTAEAILGAGAGSGASRLTIYPWGIAIAGQTFGKFAFARVGYWKIVFVIKKISGTTLNIKQYVDGVLIYDQTKTFSLSLFNSLKGSYNTTNIIYLNNQTAPSAGEMVKKQTENIIFFRELSEEEIWGYRAAIIPANPNLHWDFASNTGVVVPELITNRDGTLIDTTGLRTPYFD